MVSRGSFLEGGSSIFLVSDRQVVPGQAVIIITRLSLVPKASVVDGLVLVADSSHAAQRLTWVSEESIGSGTARVVSCVVCKRRRPVRVEVVWMTHIPVVLELVVVVSPHGGQLVVVVSHGHLLEMGGNGGATVPMMGGGGSVVGNLIITTPTVLIR